MTTSDGSTEEYTGGSVGYYKAWVANPTTPGVGPYMAECNDIIEALDMNYAEANVFKANWRRAAARQGKQKRGYTDGLYDAEKMVFFSERVVVQEKHETKAAEPFPDTVLDLADDRMDTIARNGNNGEHYAEDMTDPANWRAGDLVECVDCLPDTLLAVGKVYPINKINIDGVYIQFDPKTSGQYPPSRFRFHSRPSTSWIEWNGGECPCDDLIRVGVEYRSGKKSQGEASGYYWLHEENAWDITRYRML